MTCLHIGQLFIYFFTQPVEILGIGSDHGRIATWIGASADQTIIRVDETLINAKNLLRSTIMANKNHILILPTQNRSELASEVSTVAPHFKSLAISRHDGFCRSFSGSDQATFNGKLNSFILKNHTVTQLFVYNYNFQILGTTVNLDPLYDVVWAYNNQTGMMSSLQPTIAAQTRNDIKETIITPELALPQVAKTKVSRMQASLNILSCLDTLTNYPDVSISSNEEDTNKNVSAKSFSKEDFTPVNRYDQYIFFQYMNYI